MNLGNIEGYYWDEEKKKYFLITADHAVESRQKYTKSNVRHEKQVAKRADTCPYGAGDSTCELLLGEQGKLGCRVSAESIKYQRI